ncbi:MAG TPA: glycoside hydrolase domain-containing protein [Anaeromyxobacteraceae bacterium]|nr:glycoside hydrolase domain-containing protein [Anaeromyxobacteraceae bacterium]
MLRPTRPALCSRLALRALLALLLAAPLASRAATAWTASSMEKIRADAPARPAASVPVDVSAARNQFGAFQIAVSGAVSGVRATASVLSGPGGAHVPAPRLFQEALYTVATVSSPDSPGAGAYPDAMIPDVDDVVGEKRNAFPFDVAAGQTRVVWAEVLVPRDAPAGDYQGQVTVDGNGLHQVVDVRLHVWNFTLPATSSLRSYYGLSWPELPAGHGWNASGSAFATWATTGTSADQAFTDLRARYAQLGLDHRISISKFNDNHFEDTAWFERHYGPFLEGSGPTQLPGARLTSTMWVQGWNDSLATQQAKAAAWITRFKTHTFTDGTSWFDRLFDYTCDEPPNLCAWSTVASRNAMLKAADPRFPSLVTTTLDAATGQGLASDVDLMVVVVNWMQGKASDPEYAGPQRAGYDPWLAASPKGGARREVWLYQGCASHGVCNNFGAMDSTATGWPSLVIDAEPVRALSLEWLAFTNQASGELYYATTLAYDGHDPWTDQYLYGGHGDGTLLYPGTPARIGGTTHIPVASLRLKMIREGHEDYELLRLLSEAGDPMLASSIATGLFPTAWSVPSPAAVLAARQQIAARIEALGASATSAAAPTNPVAPSSAGGVAGADAISVSGSGCSHAAKTDLLAGLGLAVAYALRRRRRRSA